MDLDAGMNVNATTIKTLRKQKLWSQDELAMACGVSLRTIQRAEGQGEASADTLKALASALEVAVQTLCKPLEPVQNYLNIQLGYSIILLILPIVLIITWAFTQQYLDLTEFLTSMLIFALVLVLFPSLTTRVEDGFVKWHFGIGLIRKALPISRIVSNRPVINKAWWGIGVRLTPNGWLYSVSGLNSVLLVLDDGSQVRIGTDEPIEFNAAIDQARASIVASNA